MTEMYEVMSRIHDEMHQDGAGPGWYVPIRSEYGKLCSTEQRNDWAGE